MTLDRSSDVRIDLAREAVGKYFAKYSRGFSGSPLRFYAQVAAWQTGVRGGQWGSIELTGENVDRLAQLVEDSCWCPISWEACKQIAECFIERGDPLPPPLGDFAINCMSGLNKKPRKKSSGHDPYKNVIRNHAIKMAVWRASEFLPEYCEGENTQVSACDIVAEALAERGVMLSSASVVKIWKECKKRYGPQTRS